MKDEDTEHFPGGISVVHDGTGCIEFVGDPAVIAKIPGGVTTTKLNNLRAGWTPDQEYNGFESWNEYFMNMARFVAKKSKDQSVKVGMVIVGPDHEVRSTGYNGFARGVDETDPSRWERPIKYQWVEHAERNAIYNAARAGISTNGCTAYLESPPCTDCGRALIQAGIKEIVVTTKNPFADRKDWAESIQFAIDMLEEADVTVTWTDV